MNPNVANRWGALAALCVALLMVVVDATVLNLAIPEITVDLRPSAAQLVWMSDVYSLVLAGLLITAGGLGDRFGRRLVLLLGLAVFGAASAAAAFAPSPETLIAARVAHGVGGALIMPSTLSIIRNLFTDSRERGIAIGAISAVLGVGAAVGPLLGGFLLEHFWWGSVFLINIPVMVAAILMCLRFMPEFKNPQAPPMDLVGVALSIPGIGGLVFGIKQATEHGPTVTSGVSLLAGLALVAAFVVWLRRVPRPLLDVKLFRNRTFSTGVTCAGIAMFAMSGVLFVLDQYFLSVLGYGPMKAGIAGLPMIGAMMLGVLIAVPLLQRWKHRITFTASLTSMAVGMLGSWPALGQGGYWPAAAVMVVLGLGAGIALTAASDAVISIASTEKAGSAAAAEETSYELGAGLGIGVLGTGVYSLYADGLASVPGVPTETLDAARESISAAVVVASRLPETLGSRLLAEASSSFVEAIQLIALGGGFLIALAAFAAFSLIPKAAGPTVTKTASEEPSQQAPVEKR